MPSHRMHWALVAGVIVVGLTIAGAGMHTASAQDDPLGNLDLNAIKQKLQKPAAPRNSIAEGERSAISTSMSERQTRTKAIAFLKGDPYGETNAEVARDIKDTQLRRRGPAKACHGIDTPAWEFHVVVVTPHKGQFNNGVIDGYLALGAANGKLFCANLPQLD